MSRFPTSGEISMNSIATNLGIPTSSPYSLNNFVGKTLFNTNGTTFSVPAFPLSIQYFYGRYYTDPVINPITQTYHPGDTIISPPTGQIRDPTSFAIQIYAAGGGGGRGSNGVETDGFHNNVSGAGGGGGGSGGYTDLGTISYNSGMSITCSIGNGGIGGGTYNFGINGGIGGNTSVIINGTSHTVIGGNGGIAGGNSAESNPGAGGAGGAGGFGETYTGANGEPGYGGSDGGFHDNAGGQGGIGAQSFAPVGYGFGGAGGFGGSTSAGNANPGSPGMDGGDGVIIVVWDYTI
jgi:hypothetical protein